MLSHPLPVTMEVEKLFECMYALDTSSVSGCIEPDLLFQSPPFLSVSNQQQLSLLTDRSTHHKRFSGDSIKECVAIAEACETVVAVGINCTSPRFIEGLVLEIAKVTSKPILAYPNSGERYDADRKEWVEKAGVGDEDFVSYVEKWMDAGVSLLGGCCRTTPATIRAIHKRLLRIASGTTRAKADHDWISTLRLTFVTTSSQSRVFEGWNEGTIYFPPTYKYSNNSDVYAGDDRLTKAKRRTPAWCDRILWHGNGLSQLSYVRGESRFSDHRPVYSLFSVEIESVYRNCNIKKSSRVEVEELLPQRIFTLVALEVGVDLHVLAALSRGWSRSSMFFRLGTGEEDSGEKRSK
ncbi:hypothetical protein F2Q70_00041291 [Brassica cretica]|uniref:Hcy-binding domain-containing protein n=1 Tax=Brassica cretica TaxID=69181 RepID=A0A8S9K9I4_BRACR|nr:hypothetical protein F2Q70_00041291 [Brassica cretica]